METVTERLKIRDEYVESNRYVESKELRFKYNIIYGTFKNTPILFCNILH